MTQTMGPTQKTGGQGENQNERSRETPGFTQDQRFVRIRLHARGEIGDVYLARDRELQRNVASRKFSRNSLIGVISGTAFFWKPRSPAISNIRHRPGLQPGAEWGRRALLRDAVHPGREPGRGDQTLSPRTKTSCGHGGRAGRFAVGCRVPAVAGRFLDVCDAMSSPQSERHSP